MRTILSLRDCERGPHTLTYDFLDDRQHMSRLFYDGVPHILEYGCHRKASDGKIETSKLGLWRFGTKFHISLDGDDIHNTRLYEKCQPLWKIEFSGKKHDRDSRVTHRNLWNNGRAQLFDLMISQCMPLLKSLAPAQEHWQSLEDFLHCPNYALRIVGDNKAGDVRVEQISPLMKHSAVYRNYSAKSTKSVGDIPSGVPQYSPYEVIRDDNATGEEIFETPRKVRLKDGTLRYFVHGDLGSDWFEVSEIRDESLNTIRAYFEIENAAQRGLPYPSSLFRMVGVVIDHEAAAPGQEQDQGTFIAGILLPWIPGMKTLYKTRDASLEQRIRWGQQILHTITLLHGLGIAVGAEDMVYADDPFSFVNDRMILIDPHENAHLVLEDPVFAERSFDGQSYPKYARLDLEALVKVFPGCTDEEAAHPKL